MTQAGRIMYIEGKAGGLTGGDAFYGACQQP